VNSLSYPCRRALALTLAVWLPACGAGSAYHAAPSSGYHESESEGAGWQGGNSDQRLATIAAEDQASAPRSHAPPPAAYAQTADSPQARPESAPASRPQSDSGGAVRVSSSGRSKAPVARSEPSVPMKASGGKASSFPGRAEPAGQVRDVEKAPVIVYLGYLKLRVKRQLEAVDAITKLTQAAGGYIQSLSQQVMVVRIPAADFEGVMARFAAVGEVLDRGVKAIDVSRQVTDLDARLAVAVEARARLLELLRTVANVDERLQILEEVKRLTEQIEIAESTLATLRNLANYFTITIELQPVVAETAHTTHRSPFPWIQGLQAHLVTLSKGKDDVAITLPKGFVWFEDDDVWRAQAADTSMLRAGKVDNEPRGDAKFWAAAVQHEMDGRDEELVESARIGGLELRVYRNKDLRPRYWFVAVQAVDDELYVVEAFLPNEAAWQLHREPLRQALASFRVK